MDGLLRCTRYAFGPNRLHYCGPDANKEILAYMEAGETDPGLLAMMTKFQTLYPYLRLIADSNNVRDPFDDRVVEAYWLGNELLDNIGKRSFFRHLAEGLQLRKKTKSTELDDIAAPLRSGAVPHHSYHVFSVWKRTGNTGTPHSIESIDACRISWGKVVSVQGPRIKVLRRSVIEFNDSLVLGNSKHVTVMRPLDARDDIAELKPGQIITMHWDVPCEVITEQQKENLKRYTVRHMKLATTKRIEQ